MLDAILLVIIAGLAVCGGLLAYVAYQLVQYERLVRKEHRHE